MKGIMLQGTSSDVGKSVLCTAFCTLFYEKGLKVAPFKSQNMSNNSYVTKNGEEIGRAQGIQAEAANIEATVFMNPILLKPKNDCTSEVIYFGKSYCSFSGKDYRSEFYELGLEAINKAVAELSKDFEILVAEGAGSPVEINLNDREIVNMKVAEMLDLPVILVADIDRGGVFASIVGTLQLLNDEQKQRVVGIIINKFRGDLTLFDSGREWLENYTGKPVLGVIPYMHDLAIESEDSLAIPAIASTIKKEIDIAVLKLPYVSNFTDLEPFRFEKDVSIRFVQSEGEFGKPDAVIIPGTKSTINDLKFLKDNKLIDAVIQYVKAGGRVIGICGGFQMLGQQVIDKAGTDTGEEGLVVEGLQLFPIITQFEKVKDVKRSKGIIIADGFESMEVEGYEIHLGQTEIIASNLNGNFNAFIQLASAKTEGMVGYDNKVIGTYFHHIFHNDHFRNYWLNEIRKDKNLLINNVCYLYDEKKQAAYERLARYVEAHVNIPELLEVIMKWKS